MAEPLRVPRSTDAAIAPVRRERASDAAYENLRQAIMSQVFLPGERLNVRDIAHKMGVSLTPAKEALSKLAAEGLVEIRPRTGTFVTAISPEDLAETFELRAALEGVAAEKVASRLTARDAEALDGILAELERPVDTEGDRLLHERANADLHNLIVQRSGNRRLIQLYESLNAHIKIARIHRSHERWRLRLADEQAEHREVVEALKARDGERARRALSHHISRAAHSLIEDVSRTR
jgi:DNA-binding GntR family transcriptional regulator